MAAECESHIKISAQTHRHLKTQTESKQRAVEKIFYVKIINIMFIIKRNNFNQVLMVCQHIKIGGGASKPLSDCYVFLIAHICHLFLSWLEQRS